MIVHIDFPIRIFNFPWKLQQVGFTLVRFSCIRYLSNKHCTALVAMPKWDLASETMIKTIKGEVVCCPCKLQAAVVSAMVSNTCPALTTEYTEYWTDRLLDQWMDFGKEFFPSKCPIEGKKVKHLSLSCIGWLLLWYAWWTIWTLLICGLFSSVIFSICVSSPTSQIFPDSVIILGLIPSVVEEEKLLHEKTLWLVFKYAC